MKLQLILMAGLLLCAAAWVAAESPTVPDKKAEVAGELVVYCGRSKVLVDPMIEKFKAATGINVRVRYGADAELLATLGEEGERSPADLFWTNTAGTLGAAANHGLFTKLPDTLLSKVGAFVPSDGLWVPLTTRFRVLAYQPGKVKAGEIPASVMDLPKMMKFKGRIGWTPTYSSFQDFVTAMRILHGRDTAKAWLEGMKALEPKAYASNVPMLNAITGGEVDLGLTNHYYVARMMNAAKGGEAAPMLAVHHFAEGDVGNLALVTGAGILKTGKNPQAAGRLLAFLLEKDSQVFATQAVHEYPVVREAATAGNLLPSEKAMKLSPAFDFGRLRELEETLKLLREVGIL